MKHSLILIPLLAAGSLWGKSSDAQLLRTLEKRVDTLEKQNRQLRSANTIGIRFGADYRLSNDSLSYEMADGSNRKNSSLLANRLWLNMGYDFDPHITFGGQLSYQKFFGQRTSTTDLGMDGFDWFASESLQDDVLRVRSVYLNFKNDTFFGAKLPWKAGIGRRPSNNGKLINLREDDPATSPLGHISNAEFDGGNIRFYLDGPLHMKGASIKFAAGRGMSSAESRFSAAPYSSDASNDLKDITLYAVNFVPYSDRRIKTEVQYTRADNLPDITNAGYDATGTFNPALYDPSLQTVGALSLLSTYVSYDSKAVKDDFLGRALLFASLGFSQTDPDSGSAMLGSDDSETGYSLWLGMQYPSLLGTKGKVGVEFNHGSKYWRPFTYAEDTLVGSKIAARGDAYEGYWTEPLGPGLSAQLRYTYIDYEYSGSNGFFGSQTGMPMKISDLPDGTMLAANVADKAQDIRLYLRYRF